MAMVTVTPAAADEELLLNLLNSTPMDGAGQQDNLEATIAWQEWLATREGTPESDGRQVLTSARSALQSVVRGEQDAATLKPFLRGIKLTPALSDAGVEWSLGGARRSLIAARAVLAWNLIEQTKPGRLRACANPDCLLFLLDRSKANTGRWCSMQTCGNRMKARRHYEAHGQRS
jgi:predicted RNA-binding Zn ribbon-like protein